MSAGESPDGATAAKDAKDAKPKALPEPVPVRGVALVVLHSWLRTTLRLPAKVASVERWGGSTAPVTITLEGGARIRWDQLRDLTDGPRLVQAVIVALGPEAPTLPVFSRADAQAVFTVAVRAAATVEADDEVACTLDWLTYFRRVTEQVHHGSYADSGARWAALSWFGNEPTFDPRADHRAFADRQVRAPELVWENGLRYIRVLDFERFVRGVLGQQVTTAALIGRMREAGFGHRRVDARAPGARDRRVQVSVFVLPAEADLRTPEDNGAGADLRTLEDEECPQVSSKYRDRARRAHARGESLGHLRTEAQTRMNTGSFGLEDTVGLEDTPAPASDEAAEGPSEDAHRNPDPILDKRAGGRPIRSALEGSQITEEGSP